MPEAQAILVIFAVFIARVAGGESDICDSRGSHKYHIVDCATMYKGLDQSEVGISRQAGECKSADLSSY
jgi:hypothetical protein